MLNTWASINKEFVSQQTAFGVTAIYFEEMPVGAGDYPSLAVTILRQDPWGTQYFSERTPRSPAGGKAFTLLLECQVRTKAATWNQANSIAEKVRTYFDWKVFDRKTWLKADGTVNPGPQVSGFIRCLQARVDPLQDQQDRQYKSIFLTWEVEWEKPL